MRKKNVNIVMPMAGAGTSFVQAGYTFPKPLIDVNGKPMIQVVIENLKPKIPHKFIFLARKEHFQKYSLHEILKNSVKGDFEVIQLAKLPQGAACTVLTAIEHINNENELVIVNSDQLVDLPLDDFIKFARKSEADGVIMTFESGHPRWSYVRLNKKGEVIETAEKKVISNMATVGIYYFRQGKLFVESTFDMLEKDIRINQEFYVCPVYNEMILNGKKVYNWHIKQKQMHGLGTPEDLMNYLALTRKSK